MKPTRFKYGKSPNPTNWGQTSEALKSINPKKKSNPLIDKLNAIEAKLNEKK